jgi:hypothetical protein
MTLNSVQLAGSNRVGAALAIGRVEETRVDVLNGQVRDIGIT